MSSRMAGILAIVAAVVLTFLVASFALAADAPTTQSTRVTFDRYTVIAERNIFLKERSSRRPSERSTSSTQPSRRPLEESFVLVGIVREEGEWRAYVEETGRSSTRRLTAGDEVARGKVTRIDIDGIEYDAGEAPTWVAIGSNLMGRWSGGSSGLSLSSTPAAADGPTTLPFDSNDPNLTLEQRMRLRRLQGR